MSSDATFSEKLLAPVTHGALFSDIVLKRQKRPFTLGCKALFVSALFIPFSLSAAPIKASNSEKISKKNSKAALLKKNLQAIEKKISLAKNEEETQKLWDEAEGLRQSTLNGATRLLLKAAGEKEKEGDIPTMESLFSTALSLQPDNSLLRRFRASVRLKGNDPTGAVQDLGVSLQDDPGDPMSWLLLAQAQEALHQNLKALHAFHEALKRAPFLPEKDKLLKHFEKAAFGQDD